jgi:hypothetical protein
MRFNVTRRRTSKAGIFLKNQGFPEGLDLLQQKKGIANV